MKTGDRVTLTEPTVSRGDRVREFPAGAAFEYRGTVSRVVAVSAAHVRPAGVLAEPLAVVHTLGRERCRLMFPPGVLAAV